MGRIDVRDVLGNHLLTLIQPVHLLVQELEHPEGVRSMCPVRLYRPLRSRRSINSHANPMQKSRTHHPTGPCRFLLRSFDIIRP